MALWCCFRSLPVQVFMVPQSARPHPCVLQPESSGNARACRNSNGPGKISSRIRFFSFRFALAGGACRPTTAPAARSCPTPSHGTAPAPRRCWLGCRTWALLARAGTAVCQPSMDLAAFSQRIPASCRLPGAPPAWILMAATLSHQGIHRYGRQITRYMRSACCCDRKERPNRFA